LAYIYKAVNLLGIEIGGTKLQVVLGDETGTIRARRRAQVDKGRGAQGILEQLGSLLPELAGESDIQGIGVGFGGPVDWKIGKVCVSHQIEGWSGFAFASWLMRALPAPVFMENDANTAAYGEAHRGAGYGLDTVFYATLGSGVGGGLVAGGRIYHGTLPGEMEFGHVRLSREGETIESRCSGWAVDARIRSLAKAQPGSILARLCSGREGGEARHLAAALDKKDPVAIQLLEELAGDLAFGLSHVVHLCHPQIIVIGGGLAGVGEPLRGAVEQALTAWVMEAFRPGPSIALSRLGEDVVPVGALLLAAAGLKRR